MTFDEKQEILTVVGNYGNIKREFWVKLHELQRKQKEQEIHWYHAEEQINDLYKGLDKAPERKEFIDMTKKIDHDDEFERHFRSACLKEFLDINIPPEEL